MFVTIALAVLVVVVAVILMLAARKPDVFSMQRSTSIRATPGEIFPFINDFHQWQAWSPFEKLDPNMKKTFSGATSGKGAVYEWVGNGKAGAGRMEIIEASVPEKVTIKLDFIKPFEGHNTCVFTMAEKGNATETTWAMHGPVPFMAKVMHVFVNMDKMLGKDFEEGLAKLKAVAEK